MSDQAHNNGEERRAKVVTLGCRLNAYESDVIAQNADLAGLKNAVIINTCAVTNEAVRSSRQAVRRAKKDNPNAAVIVTGCAAQVDPSAFAAIAGVDRVIGNAEKMNPAIFDGLLSGGEAIRVNDIMDVTEHAPQLLGSGNNANEKLQSRARAFVQVQNGCDHRCTFCIIPYGRGNSRSVPAGEVVAHVKKLTAQGYSEVVLTGVDISSWGGDLPGQPPLGDLVRRILKLVPELPRLRLSSIDLAEIDPALLAVVKSEPRFVPYLHLSLQHGDSLILKRMKRRHSREDAIALCQQLRAARPDMTFGADIIAGFPTETQGQFAQSLSIIDEIDIAWAHIFPYSAKLGTPAAKMPAVDGAVIKARAAELREAAKAARLRHFARRVGGQDIALIEKDGFGRLPDFTPVSFTSLGAQDAEMGRTLRRISLTGYEGEHMLGTLL